MDLSASGGSAPAVPKRSPFLQGDGTFLHVDLEEFRGPMDLLLHLIRQQDIDIFDIPIARITQQFLNAVATIQAADLDNAGEFLEMAATLVRIKAQMLLPRREEDEDQDPRAELVRRLLEYEQIREIATRLQTSEAERARRFPKGYVEPRPGPAPEDTPLETTWDEVMEAAMEVSVPEPHDRRHRITTRPVAMEDKIELILETLQEEARIQFSRLLKGLETLEAKMHGVMTLLASLELSRRRSILLRQVTPFADLWLYRRDEEEEGDLFEDEWAEGEGEEGSDVDESTEEGR